MAVLQLSIFKRSSSENMSVNLSWRHKVLRYFLNIGTYVLVIWIVLAGIELQKIYKYVQVMASAQQNLVIEEKVFKDLMDAESGQSRYILTDDVRFLAQYNAAAAVINYDTMLLREYLIEDKEMVPIVDHVSDLIKLKQQEMSITLSEYKLSGIDSAVKSIKTNKGVQLTRDIRYVMDKIRARQQGKIKPTSLF